jgi:hypothetical protein
MLGVAPEGVVFVAREDIFRNDGETGACREGGAVSLEEVADGRGMVQDDEVGWTDLEAEDGTQSCLGPGCEGEEGFGYGELVKVAEDGERGRAWGVGDWTKGGEEETAE